MHLFDIVLRKQTGSKETYNNKLIYTCIIFFINVILTRNVKDYKGSAIGVLTPENYIKSIATGRGVFFGHAERQVF
jgi:hypothetical protein